MELNTWGIGRRAQFANDFDPKRYVFIERVKSHLELTLIEIKGEGQPVQIALGQKPDTADPEAASARVTPFFSSFEALDYFCQLNLQNYLACDPNNGLPRRWFWDQSRRGPTPDLGGAGNSIRPGNKPDVGSAPDQADPTAGHE